MKLKSNPRIKKALENVNALYKEVQNDRTGVIVENLLNQFSLNSITSISDDQLIEIYNVEDYNAQCLIPFLEQEEDFESCAMITSLLEYYRMFYSKLCRHDSIIDILERISKANRLEIEEDYKKLQATNTKTI